MAMVYVTALRGSIYFLLGKGNPNTMISEDQQRSRRESNQRHQIGKESKQGGGRRKVKMGSRCDGGVTEEGKRMMKRKGQQRDGGIARIHTIENLGSRSSRTCLSLGEFTPQE